MEKTTLMEVGFKTAVIFNAISIITWIFLGIFEGIYYFSIGEIGMGFQVIFINKWFYLFAITLGVALFLRTYIEEEIEEEKKTENNPE
ncbi:MAG: hypothetical protein ACFFD2_13870 [Promethearchaeota archaeon]